MIGKRVYRVIIVLFVFSSVAITFTGHSRAYLGPVCLLFLAVPWLIERIFRVRIPYPLRSFLMLFILLSFNFGTALNLYHYWVGLDKVSHGLSGVLFTIAGMCVYTKISKETNPNGNPLLRITYAFFFSMAIAALWEVWEYFGSFFPGQDPQNVLTTGITDTMHDIIICLVGSLVAVADYALYCKKGRSPLMKLVTQFDKANPN